MRKLARHKYYIARGIRI